MLGKTSSVLLFNESNCTEPIFIPNLNRSAISSLSLTIQWSELFIPIIFAKHGLQDDDSVTIFLSQQGIILPSSIYFEMHIYCCTKHTLNSFPPCRRARLRGVMLFEDDILSLGESGSTETFDPPQGPL